MTSAHIELVAWIIHGKDIAYFDYNKWKWVDTRNIQIKDEQLCI